jgi:hypothetical protein
MVKQGVREAQWGAPPATIASLDNVVSESDGTLTINSFDDAGISGMFRTSGVNDIDYQLPPTVVYAGYFDVPFCPPLAEREGPSSRPGFW